MQGGWWVNGDSGGFAGVWFMHRVDSRSVAWTRLQRREE